MKHGIILAALGAVMLVGRADAQTHSAEAVASAVLEGMRSQDAGLIASHSNAANAAFFAEAAVDPDTASELFDGTRGEAGVTWDGMILPARYRTGSEGLPEAIIPFAIETETGVAALGSGQPGRYISLVLTLDTPEDTTWGAEDINFIDRADYLAASEAR
ncbi:hypothetical protein [Hasllibacter sp. MH4015]|uniref:hypothetical protein n=1 Tax=Hasllibacter sp. MH4015 TaxID=2854029 RepID=UPI001CD2F801|nr:hypothetical protein [Hasllibacter sp. MH4015]